MNRRQHDIQKLPAGRAEGAGTNFTALSTKGGSFYQDDEPNHYSSVRGEMALFRAILIQQVVDAKSRRTKQEYDYLRTAANHWLFDNRADFQMVCDLAGWDPDVMREKLMKARDRDFLRDDGVRQQPTKERTSRRQILKDLGIYPTVKPKRPQKLRRASRLMQELGLSQMELVF